MAEHSGHIRVEDNQPAGARFTVEIPAIVRGVDAVPQRHSKPGGARAALGHPVMKPRRILVVDDEPGIRQSLSGVLEDEGYAVEGRGQRRGVPGHVCPAGGFELVLLDIWLPGMDGMEVLARIQEMPFPERPVVVVISGHGNIETAVKATKLGALDFLEKPLSIEKVARGGQERPGRTAASQSKTAACRADSGLALPHHRRKRPHEGAAPAARADGRHQWPRADLWRKRRRQGTGGARAPRHEPARRRAVRGSQLRRHSRRADRKRAFRPP